HDGVPGGEARRGQVPVGLLPGGHLAGAGGVGRVPRQRPAAAAHPGADAPGPAARPLLSDPFPIDLDEADCLSPAIIIVQPDKPPTPPEGAPPSACEPLSSASRPPAS